jgi:hypothetical protein
MATQLTITWGEAEKPHDQRKRWLGSWLVSREGEEGEYFYDGPGGTITTHNIPAEAIGLRLRWWPPDSQVDLNLEFGPLPTLAKEYFFSSGSGQTVTIGAMEVVR